MSKIVKRKIREMVYLVMELNEKGWNLTIRVESETLELKDTNCKSIIKSERTFIYLKGIPSIYAEKEIEETNKMLKEWLQIEVC